MYMSAPDYQNRIKKFVVYDKSVEFEYLKDGLVAEVGEFVGKVAKSKRGDCELDQATLIQELGDIQFFVTMLCSHYKIEQDQLFRLNYDKLQARFNRGVIRGNGDDR